MIYIIFSIAIILNALANILMKIGALKPDEMTKKTDVIWNMLTNPVIIAGVISFGLALAAYNYVLTKTNLSVAYPIMTSLGYVIVILISWLFLKETITLVQCFGFICIIAGVWMVAQ